MAVELDSGGVRADVERALDSFLKGASRGSTLAMVDAGIIPVSYNCFWPQDLSSTRESQAYGQLNSTQYPILQTAMTDGDFHWTYGPFFDAVRDNDWHRFQAFVSENPEAVRARIPGTGKTALHVAVLAGHLHMVKYLAEMMTEEDLELRENDEATAFGDAVCNGTSLDIVKIMVQKNRKLLEIGGRDGMLPVAMAFAWGYFEMGTYLYSVTPTQALFDQQRHAISAATVLTSSIRMLQFDIALDLLQRYPTLAFELDFERKSPIFALACTSFAFPSGTYLSFLQRLVYAGIKVSLESGNYGPQHSYNMIEVYSEGSFLAPLASRLRVLFVPLLKFFKGSAPIIGHVYHAKQMHLKSIRLLSAICGVVKTLNHGDPKYRLIHEAIMEATDRGLVEFIEALAKANPDLLASCTDNQSGMNVFQRAIRSRQADIYSLLRSLPLKEAMLARRDNYGNTALHIAGQMAPSHRLTHIPGAALRMQRELQWFKEVEKIIPNHLLESKNNEMLTPRQVFTSEHKYLMEEGERWIKETSSFCVFSGSLVVTIMFAAAITIPGGNDQNTGFPIFRHKKLFRVFMISDILSVFSATTSLFEFLGVNAARYAEEDFLKGLPTKITKGVLLLLFSILTMVIAFCSVILMMFEKDIAMIVLVGVVTVISVASFMSQVIPLLADIFKSTYGPSIFHSKAKRSIVVE